MWQLSCLPLKKLLNKTLNVWIIRWINHLTKCGRFYWLYTRNKCLVEDVTSSLFISRNTILQLLHQSTKQAAPGCNWQVALSQTASSQRLRRENDKKSIDISHSASSLQLYRHGSQRSHYHSATQEAIDNLIYCRDLELRKQARPGNDASGSCLRKYWIWCVTCNIFGEKNWQTDRWNDRVTKVSLQTQTRFKPRYNGPTDRQTNGPTDRLTNGQTLI